MYCLIEKRVLSESVVTAQQQTLMTGFVVMQIKCKEENAKPSDKHVRDFSQNSMKIESNY